jgi:hypothetical protein
VREATIAMAAGMPSASATVPAPSATALSAAGATAPPDCGEQGERERLKQHAADDERLASGAVGPGAGEDLRHA